MGERQDKPFHFTFNSSLDVGYQGSQITSDTRSMPVRELDERGTKYALQIPAGGCALRDIAELLVQPVGRPAHEPVVCCKGFLYWAAGRTAARRLVAKVESHAGELVRRPRCRESESRRAKENK